MRASLVVLTALAIMPAWAQTGAGQAYDPASETTIQGTIQQVRQIPSRRWTGTHIVVNTQQGPMDVALGPSWFINQQQLNLAQGSQVRVTGSQVTYDGRRMIVARQLESGGRTTLLRNAMGVPMWSRGQAMAGAARPAAGYDASQETRVQGTIQEFRYVARGPVTGRHVVLNTQQGPVEVALGPSAFLEEQQVDLAVGDRLTVTAAPSTFDGRPVFIAREIETDGNVVALRNAQGFPLWAGTGMDAGRMPGRARGIYNPQTETTIDGTVQSLNQCSCGPWTGSYAVVSTGRGPINVLLGPSNYIRSRQMQISRGDRVRITGSRIDADGTELLLARTISRGGQSIALRDARGMPYWARGTRATAPATDEMNP